MTEKKLSALKKLKVIAEKKLIIKTLKLLN